MKKKNIIVAVSAAFLLSVAFARPCPVYAADGWQQNDTGVWVYYENDKPVKKQWIQNEDGTWRYADGNGQMVVGKFLTLDEEKYYFDADGLLVENQWFSVESTVTEPSKKVSTTWYYAGEHGRIYRGGWLTVGDGTFYFGTGGNATRSGLFNLKVETGEVDENGEAVTITKKYYIDETYGRYTNGWFPIYKVNDDGSVTTNWYYADAEGSLYYGGFREIDGYTYYFDANGVNYRGRWYTDAETKERYYLDAEGHLQGSGWYTTYATTGVESAATYYANADGSVWKGNCYLEVDGKTYYFTTNGAISKKRWMVDAGKGRKYLNEDGVLMENEWFRISGTSASTGADYTYWYYAAEDGRVLRSGWHTVGENQYYFNASGVMQTGWVDGSRYYCGEDGAKVYGWQFVPLKESWLVSTETELMEYVGDYGDTAWFYFSPLTGRVYYSEEDTYKEIKVDGVTYCVDERGIIQQGWIQMRSKSPTIRSYKYYMEADYKGYSGAVTVVAGENMVLADVRAAAERQEAAATPSEASPSDTAPAEEVQSTEWHVGQMVNGGWFRVVGPDAESTGNEEWFYFKDSGK